jgi:hypothetical protein
MTIISDFLFAINEFFSGEGVFLICLSLMLLGFFINLILTLVREKYDRQSRRWYYFSLPSILCFQIAQSLNAGENGALIFLSLSIACLLFYFSWSIKSRGEKAIRQARAVSDFCKKIQTKVDESQEKERLKQTKNEQENAVKVATGEDNVEKLPQNKNFFDQDCIPIEEQDLGLDFSHVKNVMKRLDYFSLSPTDKRQVKELEITLKEVESGEDLPSLKERLNDGLGMLLRIMAKYGV